ncbi:proline aminopeptidase P II [Catenovulum maritimum]|uniref:Xaa-Pro aminopeptidase n=1 Tax=Catenovulum maritimum TaxID=1513271 RepID=A0A0J8GRH3_9ALTE|nr:proline aminopeptidase P II [Catenovulum maritimum]
MSLAEYQQRIENVLSQMADNSVAIIAAASEQTRSNDTEYPFRQDSDFFYLTGFNEPDAFLVLSKKSETSRYLFCRAKDKFAEIWNGRRAGPEQASQNLGLEQGFAIETFDAEVQQILNGVETIYWLQGKSKQVDKRIFNLVQQIRDQGKLSLPPYRMFDLRQIMHEMRLVKSNAELEIMQQAADISCKAHKRAMQRSQAGVMEYQLEADILHEFAQHGARFAAYNTIVAAGDNACILHYTENADRIEDGDLVLIDAGCELHGYAADITRTFPANGKFTPAQAKLYQLTLDAQLASMQYLKPGNTLKQATDVAVEVITKGLIKLGLLTGSLEQNLASEEGKPAAYRQFFMHGLGHWLGLDVHDVGLYKVAGQDRPLEAGMVLTVEPGIYVAQDAEVDEQWRGIGIRIEDNVIITQDGYQVITDAAPKTISEIEALMQGK